MKKSKSDIEFQEFQKSEGTLLSRAISDKVFNIVRSDLNPSPYLVFSKLMGIHFVTALMTLSVFPQFGFRIFGEGMGLMHYFMNLGQHGCLVACGAFFTGTSLLMAGLILRGEELRVIRKNRFLELGAITLLSLGFFIMLDAEIIFGLTLAWFLGAMMGSLVTLELVWGLRFKVASSVK